MCLVGGNIFLEGWVEIYINGFWGIICDKLWDDVDVKVVCGMLGFFRLVWFKYCIYVNMKLRGLGGCGNL